MKKKPKKYEAPCECVVKVNKQLVERNAVLVIKSIVNMDTGDIRPSSPVIAVEKYDPKGRKPLPTIFCRYCPFCGKDQKEPE